MNKVCVIGSINMDYITESDRFPMPGETIIGKSFDTKFGGKGANQAVAAAKLGAEVFFIGACGNDSIYDDQIANLKQYGINTEGVMRGVSHSGIAQITIVDGENSIIVAPGSNKELTVDWVDLHHNLIEMSDVVIVQLEIPIEVVEHSISIANKLNKIIILNPAPVHDLSNQAIEQSTYITPNEIEIEQLFNLNYKEALKTYKKKIIMTKGSEGVLYHDENEIVHIEALKVDSVDTTGAGDTFNGALAYALSNYWNLNDAIKFSNKAASKSILKIGAQTAMPTMEEMK